MGNIVVRPSAAIMVFKSKRNPALNMSQKLAMWDKAVNKTKYAIDEGKGCGVIHLGYNLIVKYYN